MKVSKKGINFIKKEEGCRLVAYAATKSEAERNIYTIGYGNTFYSDGTPVKKGDKITQKQADDLFRDILSKFEKDVAKLVTAKLNPSQFSALVSLTFNIGVSALRTSTVLKRVNANPEAPSIAEAFEMWRNAGPNKGILLPRRKREVELYFSESFKK